MELKENEDKIIELYYTKEGEVYFYNFSNKNIYTLESDSTYYNEKPKDDWFFSKYGIIISILIYHITKIYMQFSNTILDIVVLAVVSLVTLYYSIKINKGVVERKAYINSRKSELIKEEFNQEILNKVEEVLDGGIVFLTICLIAATGCLYLYFKYSMLGLVSVVVGGYALAIFLIIHVDFYNKYKVIKEMKKMNEDRL